jgi:hypothetical protein
MQDGSKHGGSIYFADGDARRRKRLDAAEGRIQVEPAGIRAAAARFRPVAARLLSAEPRFQAAEHATPGGGCAFDLLS